MDIAKDYLWQRLISQIESSDDEKLKNNIKAFKNKEELIKYTKFYSGQSFDDMKRIASLNYWFRKHVYHVKDERLLGNKTKAMPDKVYKQLLKYVGVNVGEKQRLVLEFEGLEGARGEDAVRIKLEDLDFKNHIVRIINRKRDGRIYEVPLNKNLEKELKQFILDNKDQIELHNNFIFFSNNPKFKRNHLSQKYLKTLVYSVLKKLNLNKVYTKSIDGRNLYLYSLHSLRGHAGSRVYEKSNHDIKKVQELLDHQPNSADTTLLYIERDVEKDLKGVI